MWPIDTEVSALEHEILGAGEGGGRELISFQRYDVMLDPEWIARECGMTVGEPDVVRIDDFVNPKIMKDAYAIAAKAAASQVQKDDFPAVFDVVH